MSASSDGALRGWTPDPRPRALMRASPRTGAVPVVAVTKRAATMTGWDDGNVRCHSNATGASSSGRPGRARRRRSPPAGGARRAALLRRPAALRARCVWDARRAAHQHAWHRGGGGRGVPRGRRARRLGVAGPVHHHLDLVREATCRATHAAGRELNAFELHRADGRDATRMVSVGQDRSLSFWDPAEDRALQVVLRRARVQERTRRAPATRTRGFQGPEREAVTSRRALCWRRSTRTAKPCGGGVFARRIDARQRGRRDRHGGTARGGAVRRGRRRRGFFCVRFFFFL